MSRSLRGTLPFLVLIFIIIAACAKISAPSGGPKDITPPMVLSSVPRNGSSNFTGENFMVTFNEFIVLDKITEKFMVSPPLSKNPVITATLKNLVVKFDEKLKDSTTYTFYFQDAIRDLNEGNPLSNYQFVFSTGSVVDSLSVTGNVYSSLNLEAGADLLVIMHRNLADSVPRKMQPTYITKTDKTGNFKINNVRSGKYKLYVLGDGNNNKRYDVSTEVFAFLDSVINITPERNYIPLVKVVPKPVAVTTPNTPVVQPAGEFQLFTFTGPKKSQYLTPPVRRNAYSIVYIFAMPLDTAKFNFSIIGATPESYFIEPGVVRDTFKIWITDSTIYSKELLQTIVQHPVTDTTGTLVTVTDTISMRFITPREVRGERAPEKLAYTLNLSGGLLKPNTNLVINSQAPLAQPDTSRIKLYETKDTIRVKVPFTILNDKSNSCRIFINSKLKENGKYLLILDSAAITDLYGIPSDSVGIKFTVRSRESFGALAVNLKGYDKDIIAQLLDANENVVQTQFRIGPGRVLFSQLEKGMYRLRVIYDLNGDKKWTTGDYDLLIQPEPVTYYPEEIEIRLNWDRIEDLDLSTKNFKNQALRKKPA